tara:strand:- start:122 stop:289 length:168 start_codon:yes stop_codon:yes gene_type:complete
MNDLLHDVDNIDKVLDLINKGKIQDAKNMLNLVKSTKLVVVQEYENSIEGETVWN